VGTGGASWAFDFVDLKALRRDAKEPLRAGIVVEVATDGLDAWPDAATGNFMPKRN
jgi:hypothetical protein